MGSDDAHADGARREPDLRVGDDERSAALDALGAHLGAGRLDVDEFGDRSERAAVAVYRSDLEALFTDLPAPHPPLPRPPAVTGSTEGSGDRSPRVRPVPPVPGRSHPAAMLPVFAVVMVLVLVLPTLAVGAATGSVGGLLFLPLLFVVLGHARRGWHGPGGPHGGHQGGPHRGPRDRW